MTRDAITLTAGDAEVTVRPDIGGRVQSLRIDGLEVLRQGDRYGSFPMVPWCGRMRDGHFRNGALEHRMPQNSPPHAIHGTGRNLAWRTARHDARRAVLTYELADPHAPWPYPGTVTQIIELAEDGASLTFSMGIETYDDSFPAQAGWHPWFLRSLGPDGDDVTLDFKAEWQEERGEDGLPTGRRVEPTAGPWDDCFGMPGGVDVTLTWPGQLALQITSREQWAVIYDEQEAAVCVEPQTGPPNGINTAPRPVTPVDPLETAMTWSWRTLA